MTDAQLIERYLDGDITAFNTLVWRWENNIFNFVLRYVGNREEAKDLSQKTFIRVYRKLHHLRDMDKFSSWIYQIAINLCRDELKNRRRRQTYSLEGLQENDDGGANTNLPLEKATAQEPHDGVCSQDLREILNKALQAIPEEQRVVIIMKEYQGLKFTEIAEALQVSVNTAKSRMYYGLHALKKVFNKWNIDKESLLYEV
ncbi:MAG: RNA polymerase sigma factor [bacterium]